jgi:hypothetical protein
VAEIAGDGRPWTVPMISLRSTEDGGSKSAGTGVLQVRQRIVRADRVDGVALQALRDQDGRHLPPVACAQEAAIATRSGTS